MRQNRRPLDDLLIDTTDRDGHRWSVSPSGWCHPVVSGAEGEPDPEPKPDPKPEPSGISVAEVERREKAAREAATQELLAQFGDGMTADQLKAILDERKAAEDAKKDEATKAREAADREKTAALAEKDQAASERLAARVERFLIRAGVAAGVEKDEEADNLIERARGALGPLKADSDDETVKAAVAKLKEDVPALFGTVSKPSGGGSPPPPPPRGTPKPNTEDERKQRLEAIAARTGIR